MRAIRTLLICCIVCLPALPLSPLSFAESATLDDLQRQIEQLQQGQQAMQKELRELKNILQRSQRQTTSRSQPVTDLNNTVLNIDDDPIKGETQTRLVIMEFSDYQCPYCARHKTQVLPRIEQNYINTGKLRYVFRDFPLERIHKQALAAAMAANCAGEQDQYWPMHDRLFANRKSLQPLSGHAEALDLDMTAFNTCLDSEKYAAEVRADMAEGRRAGVSKTPSFILGILDEKTSQVTGIKLIQGALSYDRMKTEIDRWLATTPATETAGR